MLGVKIRRRYTYKSYNKITLKAMKRIIINADDFGINDKVTSEIEKFIKKGAISSATIMANGKSLEYVEKIVKEHPEVSYGVHLCMDEFDSLTSSEILNKYGIIDNENKFIRGAIFEIKQFPCELKEAIISELSAQIDKLLSMEIPISHVDSHHNFHTIYALKDVISYVMDKYNIEKVRLSNRISIFQILRNNISKKNRAGRSVKPMSFVNKKTVISKISNMLSLIKTKYFIFMINKYYANKYKVTCGFESYSSFFNNEKVRKQYKSNQSIELMCHPGHLGKQYQEEAINVYEMLLVKSSNYQLISYNELLDL